MALALFCFFSRVPFCREKKGFFRDQLAPLRVISGGLKPRVRPNVELFQVLFGVTRPISDWSASGAFTVVELGKEHLFRYTVVTKSH